MGVNLERDEETGLIKMKQPLLINPVISAVGIDDGMAKGKYTHDGCLFVVQYEDGVPYSGGFKYLIVVGIFPYLSGHTCPDISFAVMYGHEKLIYPTCVKSCTGYVSHFQIVLIYFNQSYIHRHPSWLWKHKLLL